MINLWSALISHFDYPQIIFLLKAIKGGFSKQSCRIELADAIYQYVLDCYKKSDVNPHTIDDFVEMTNDKTVELFSNISDSFHILGEKVEFILNKHKKKIKDIHFDIFPLVGLLICPDSRYIAVFDCSHNIDPAQPEGCLDELYYYRINSY